MTGLILKDALVLKKSLKSYLLLLAVYAVLTVTGLFSISFVAAFLEVIAMMLPMSAFAFDEQAHWDRYAAGTWWPPGICSPCWCCCALRPLGRPCVRCFPSPGTGMR